MVIVPKISHSFAIPFLLIFLSSLKTIPSKAQTIDNIQPELPLPQDVQRPSPRKTPQTPSPQKLPPPSELFKPTEPLLPSDEDFPTEGQMFVVKQFKFTGNTAFSDKELNQLLGNDFTHKQINFAKLAAARDKITKHYIEKGYITSGAYIPEQTLTNGVVEIRIIEGKLEGIQITGLRRLKPNYIRSRIALATSTPFNQKKLLKALELLLSNFNNGLIENLQARLIQGSQTGTNLLIIEVKEADSFNTGRTCII